VAGSLLNAAGVPELIARSLEQYEQLAVALAHDSGRLSALRCRINNARNGSSLFDLPKLAGYIEAAYDRMWQHWLSGQAPRAFALESE
jgi:predicted O-linked N-acetylglucosamine transferase (SPINDLY family)